MSQWINPDNYEFYSENDKQEFIMDTFFDRLYYCPVCSEGYTSVTEAYDCCHTDCYEQDKEFIIEERADERLRSEKGD